MQQVVQQTCCTLPPQHSGNEGSRREAETVDGPKASLDSILQNKNSICAMFERVYEQQSSIAAVLSDRSVTKLHG